MNAYPIGFERDETLRSNFVRELTLRQMQEPEALVFNDWPALPVIPRTLIRFWHDDHDLPSDVAECLSSWERLREHGFELLMLNDRSASEYIGARFTALERSAFERCRHPAMRCDYLRLCVLVAQGGLYVDADDVLLGDEWKRIFQDARLKVQPLCYDIPSHSMVQAKEIWKADLPTDGRIFYVNNDPIAAPANHPVLRRALTQATEKLLGKDRFPEIQATTGPGNLTEALTGHAQQLMTSGASLDFELIRNWDAIAETRWDLSYRSDARNWRNMTD